MGLLGLDEVLSYEKLERLEAMAATMERVADKMDESSRRAKEAADTMLEASTQLENQVSGDCDCDQCP